MAHVTDTGLSPASKRYSYTLGLRTLKRTRAIYQSQEVEEELLDSRWGGSLVIPEQSGVYANPENLRDNDHFGRLDPITWVEEMAGGLNTSEFELLHPTIEADTPGASAVNYFNLQGSPVIENNALKISVTKAGKPTVARGQYVKLFGTGALDSPRIYKVVRLQSTFWWLVPGRMPWAATPLIAPADSMRFRLLNPNDIEEYLDYRTRGPYRMDWIEAR